MLINSHDQKFTLKNTFQLISLKKLILAAVYFQKL